MSEQGRGSALPGVALIDRHGRHDPGGVLREIAIRRRAGAVVAQSRYRPVKTGAGSGSPGSSPCRTSSISALSATVRARAPITDRPSQPGTTGAEETRPRLGFIPTRPQHAAGIRIDPPPSDAVAAGTSPAATAAAEPPEDPPGVRSRRHGLRVIPLACVTVQGKMSSSGVVVIPTGIAPAARSRRITSASATAGGPWVRDPRVAMCPATATSSLSATGTPARGPLRSVIASAAASASSALTSRKAFRRGSSASIRPRKNSTSSRGLTAFWRTSAASATGPANAMSMSVVVLIPVR